METVAIIASTVVVTLCVSKYWRQLLRLARFAWMSSTTKSIDASTQVTDQILRSSREWRQDAFDLQRSQIETMLNLIADANREAGIAQGRLLAAAMSQDPPVTRKAVDKQCWAFDRLARTPQIIDRTSSLHRKRSRFLSWLPTISIGNAK